MGIMKPVFSSVFGPIIPDVNWTPNSLFALAEPGVWYDPSDLTTMFQDREGTTPVTASGQFVGLRLDNSKGLVLGSELVTNGNNEVALYSGAGAIGGSIARGAAPGGGFAAVFTCNSGFLSCQALYQTIAANTPIKISVRVYVPTGSLNAIQLFDANDGSWRTSTTSTKDSWVTLTAIRAAKATPWILGIGQIAGQLLAGQVFYVDDLSVKQLPGNHAVAIDDAARGTYGTDGVYHWVQYDGSNDGYVTPTITPGIDKVQVFAGVRKLSDAASGALIELSAASSSNNGSFFFSAPPGDLSGYFWRSKGTSESTFDTTTPAAPSTDVLTGIGDIAGDLSVIRIDGVVVGTNTADQGTGNFLAYPLYIGRRGGTTLPFNGRDYGIIVRFGPNLGATTIESAEDWIAKKTGVIL
jgi:hypothetical protein